MKSLLKRIADLEKRAGAYDPNADYSGKYMLAFYFDDDHNLPHCHCTHHYLEKLDPTQVQDVIKVVDNYFEENPWALKQKDFWIFDSPQMFVEEHDTPVLEATPTKNMLLDLKEQLQDFKRDQFPVYRPHITLPEQGFLRFFIATPIKYALVSGDVPEHEWIFS